MLPREDEPRCLDLMAGELETAGEAGFERFLDGTLAQPRRAPAAFVWLAERAADDEAVRNRNPLRLVQQVLATLAQDEFAPYRVRLRKLLDSGGTVPRAFSSLGEDQAAAAAEAIRRGAGLEAYQRDNLVAALELRFPSLRVEAAAGDSILYARPESIAAKRAELDHLTRVELPANRKAIEEARALGDLRENFEYKSARQRHELLSALATELNRDLGRARPIDFERIDPSQVRVGTRVQLRSADGERTVTILGPWESEPEKNVVSYESELAAGLLGKSVGDSAEVAGGRVEVVTIERAR
jgi:transcription elongation GreA/GreB family factor